MLILTQGREIGKKKNKPGVSGNAKDGKERRKSGKLKENNPYAFPNDIPLAKTTQLLETS